MDEEHYSEAGAAVRSQHTKALYGLTKTLCNERPIGRAERVLGKNEINTSPVGKKM